MTETESLIHSRIWTALDPVSGDLWLFTSEEAAREWADPRYIVAPGRVHPWCVNREADQQHLERLAEEREWDETDLPDEDFHV